MKLYSRLNYTVDIHMYMKTTCDENEIAYESILHVCESEGGRPYVGTWGHISSGHVGTVALGTWARFCHVALLIVLRIFLHVWPTGIPGQTKIR